jgi:hypothetical protein
MFLMVGLAEFNKETLQPVQADAANQTNGISLTVDTLHLEPI